jgi:hypothetical protein
LILTRSRRRSLETSSGWARRAKMLYSTWTSKYSSTCTRDWRTDRYVFTPSWTRSSTSWISRAHVVACTASTPLKDQSIKSTNVSNYAEKVSQGVVIMLLNCKSRLRLTLRCARRSPKTWKTWRIPSFTGSHVMRNSFYDLTRWRLRSRKSSLTLYDI